MTGGLSQVARVVPRTPPMDAHRQHVLLLHGEAEVRVVLVLQLPLILVLVKGEQPAGGTSVLPWVASTAVEHLVAKQKIVCVHFGGLTQTLQAEPQFLLEPAHEAPDHIPPVTDLGITSEVVPAVGRPFA